MMRTAIQLLDRPGQAATQPRRDGGVCVGLGVDLLNRLSPGYCTIILPRVPVSMPILQDIASRRMLCAPG